MTNSLGQLMICGIDGYKLSQEEIQFLGGENIGGVILFSRNYESPSQLIDLCNSIQSLRSEYPLFISVDYEGGRVQRFKTHFTQIPAMKVLADNDTPKICYEVHRIMAEELSVCGINLNFSPVCDILTNSANKVIGDRSFGGDHKIVSNYVSAAIRGLQANGILACAKHFPGHGGTFKDSHFELPYVSTTIEQLQNNEFITFQKASKARVEFIMMAHLVVDCIDPNLPCTLSAKSYSMIREELKFSKIIITDDMEMKAITNFCTPEEAAILALGNGCDILLYQGWREGQKAFKAVQGAVKTKKIKKKDIENKLERIFFCKKKYLSNYRPASITEASGKINSKESQEILKKFHLRPLPAQI